MKAIAAVVFVLGCGFLDKEYPDPADEPFTGPMPSFQTFLGAGGSALKFATGDEEKPIIDLETCRRARFASRALTHDGYAVVDRRGDTCAIWLGKEVGTPPRQYCVFERAGHVRLDLTGGDLDHPACFPLVARVPSLAERFVADANPLLVRAPGTPIVIELDVCTPGRHVDGPAFAIVQPVEEGGPRACEVYFSDGRYCAFPARSFVRIERTGDRLSIDSTRCFQPEY